MVDCERLISLVFEREGEPIWDSTSKKHHNRDITRKLWKEIETEMQVKSDILKTKWASLRDTFRKEFKKLKRPTGSGLEDGIVESQWKYFESLYFLKDNITPRNMVGNIIDQSKTYTDDQESCPNSPGYTSIDVVNDFDETNISEKNASPSISSFQAEPSPKKKKRKNEVIEDFLAIEKQKLLQFNMIQANTQKKNEDDDDYHFLMSLLPHLREIPTKRKLAVRLKLQNVLMAEQTENNYDIGGTSNTPSTFYGNSLIPPITSYYTNQPEYSSSNGSSNIKNTILCGQTNMNPAVVDNTCISSWENVNNG